MSSLASITRGKIALPPRIVLYGTEKIGKTTLAAKAPRPIIVQTESGSDEINCERFPIATKLSDVSESLAALSSEPHEYRTVVIDSLDWLERLIFDATCVKFGVANIELVDKGYGKGYVHALHFWREFLFTLDYLRTAKNMCVICIAHAKVEKFEDPDVSTPFDRYSLKLHKLAAALLSEWADAVLFATREIIIKEVAGGFNKTRATAQGLGKDGGDRILKCIGGPSCVAGNRYSLPEKLPLSWDALAAGIGAAQGAA